MMVLIQNGIWLYNRVQINKREFTLSAKYQIRYIMHWSLLN
jgi:hypothetical protein